MVPSRLNVNISLTRIASNSRLSILNMVRSVASATIVTLSTGNPAPAATVIGEGGVLPPLATIDDDGLTTYEPETDGIDFYESLEGMHVRLVDAVAVAPSTRFGEIYAVADRGADATGYSARGAITVSAGDFNPERIQIDGNLRRFVGVRRTSVGAMIEEFRWEHARESGDEDTAGFESLNQLSAFSERIGVFEELGKRRTKLHELQLRIARLGQQTGEAVWAFRKAVPRAARRSIFGVWVFPGYPPKKPTQSFRSSTAIKRTLGLSCVSRRSS